MKNTRINRFYRRVAATITSTSFIFSIGLGDLVPVSNVTINEMLHIESQNPVTADLKIDIPTDLHVEKNGLKTVFAKPKPSPALLIASQSYQRRIPQPIPEQTQLDSWFNSYGQAFNVDPTILKSIASCESHLNPNSNTGVYGGMYQYMASTWSSTRRAMGQDPNPELRFDAEESIKTTAWKISVGGIGAWPHCSKIALNNRPVPSS